MGGFFRLADNFGFDVGGALRGTNIGIVAAESSLAPVDGCCTVPACNRSNVVDEVNSPSIGFRRCTVSLCSTRTCSRDDGGSDVVVTAATGEH